MSDEKLIVTKSKLDALATSISNKSGVATPLTIAQMKAAVDAMAGGGTIIQDENGYLVISENGEQGDGQLRYSIDDVLTNNAPVDSVLLPTVTRLKDSAFYGNVNITFVDAPNVTRIGGHAFRSCTKLKNVNFPLLEYAGTIFQNNQTALTNDSITNTTPSYSFAYCHSLEKVYFPKLRVTGAGMFYQINVSSSQYNTIVVMPLVEQIGNFTFRQGKFKAIDLGSNLTKIWNYGFYSGVYDVVILRSPTVVQAASNDAVSGITKLYVPSALVSDYATATNWATNAANRTVLPIEGSIYETQYADGTPISS